MSIPLLYIILHRMFKANSHSTNRKFWHKLQEALFLRCLKGTLGIRWQHLLAVWILCQKITLRNLKAKLPTNLAKVHHYSWQEGNNNNKEASSILLLSSMIVLFPMILQAVETLLPVNSMERIKSWPRFMIPDQNTWGTLTKTDTNSEMLLDLQFLINNDSSLP